MTDPPVHPAAAVFPMLSDEELADLAEDIKANGLLEPLVLDDDGVLIDGRNRYAACRLAGVEPTFVRLDGHDALAFILSRNAGRRHLSKGQLAMSVVLAYLEDARARGEPSSAGRFSFRRGERAALAGQFGIPANRLSEAAVIAAHAPERALLVRDGTEYLQDVYREVSTRERELDGDARRKAELDAKAARLRRDAPDLADLVAEWRMSLDEAVGVLDRREADERERRARQTRQYMDGMMLVWGSLFGTPGHLVETWLPEASVLRANPSLEHLWTADGMRALADLLEEAADAVDRHCEGRLP